jgi:PAS domain S-box-containing protein
MPDNDESLNKFRFLFSVFLLAGVVAAVMGFVRWQTSPIMGAIDFVFAALNFGLLYYLRSHQHWVDTASSIALALSFLLFSAIYVLVPQNTMRLSLFFLLTASAFFLKGRTAGRIWLAVILFVILAVHFSGSFSTGYSPLDIGTTCIYLIALLFIFENYETFKERERERKRSEEEARALRESEQRLRVLFDASPDPVWIIDDHHFVECNQAAVDMLGYPDKEALRNTHPSALSPEYQPDGESSFTKAEKMMNLAKEKRLHRFEWVHTRKDGSNFFAEVTLSAMTLQGRPVLHCLWRDITERKKVEEGLRRAQGETERLLAEAKEREFFLHQSQQVGQIGGWRANPVNNTVMWTEGIYDIVELPQDYKPDLDTALDFYLPDSRTRVVDNLKKSLASGDPFSIQVQLRGAKSGQIKWTELRGQAHLDAEGHVDYLMGTLDRKSVV